MCRLNKPNVLFRQKQHSRARALGSHDLSARTAPKNSFTEPKPGVLSRFVYSSPCCCFFLSPRFNADVKDPPPRCPCVRPVNRSHCMKCVSPDCADSCDRFRVLFFLLLKKTPFQRRVVDGSRPAFINAHFTKVSTFSPHSFLRPPDNQKFFTAESLPVYPLSPL